MSRALAARLARASWLHCLLAGIGLHMACAALEAPERIAVLGPSAEDLAAARKAWFGRSGRAPDAAQEKALAASAEERALLFAEALRRGYHRDDPVVRGVLVRGMRFADQGLAQDDATLFRRAIERDLHRHDPVVRQRLVQRVEMSATTGLPTPDDADLRALFYDPRPERYQLEPRLDLTQRFFSADRHPKPMEEARLQQRLGGGAPPPDAGNPFLHGERFAGLTPRRAAQLFGADFSQALFALPAASTSSAHAGRWHGPLRSVYGAHLARIDHYRPPRRQGFAEVRDQALAEWRRQQRRAARRALLSRLRERYVVVDAS